VKTISEVLSQRKVALCVVERIGLCRAGALGAAHRFVDRRARDEVAEHPEQFRLLGQRKVIARNADAAIQPVQAVAVVQAMGREKNREPGVSQRRGAVRKLAQR